MGRIRSALAERADARRLEQGRAAYFALVGADIARGAPEQLAPDASTVAKWAGRICRDRSLTVRLTTRALTWAIRKGAESVGASPQPMIDRVRRTLAPPAGPEGTAELVRLVSAGIERLTDRPLPSHTVVWFENGEKLAAEAKRLLEENGKAVPPAVRAALVEALRTSAGSLVDFINRRYLMRTDLRAEEALMLAAHELGHVLDLPEQSIAALVASLPPEMAAVVEKVLADPNAPENAEFIVRARAIAEGRAQLLSALVVGAWAARLPPGRERRRLEKMAGELHDIWAQMAPTLGSASLSTRRDLQISYEHGATFVREVMSAGRSLDEKLPTIAQILHPQHFIDGVEPPAPRPVDLAKLFPEATDPHGTLVSMRESAGSVPAEGWVTAYEESVRLPGGGRRLGVSGMLFDKPEQAAAFAAAFAAAHGVLPAHDGSYQAFDKGMRVEGNRIGIWAHCPPERRSELETRALAIFAPPD